MKINDFRGELPDNWAKKNCRQSYLGGWRAVFGTNVCGLFNATLAQKIVYSGIPPCFHLFQLLLRPSIHSDGPTERSETTSADYIT